jgi:hypothetical protein
MFFASIVVTCFIGSEHLMGVTSLAARCLPGLAGATLTASFPWIPVQRYGEKNTQSRENPDWERNWENWENPIFTFSPFLPFYLFTFLPFHISPAVPSA